MSSSVENFSKIKSIFTFLIDKSTEIEDMVVQ